MDDPLKKRRQILQAAGVGGTALLAGCSGLLDSSDNETDDAADEQTDTDNETNSDDGTGGDDEMDNQNGEQNNVQSGDTREVGLVAQPDQQAIAELQQQLQAGEIERQEAVEQQRDLISQSVEELTSAIESETEITVAEQLPEIGALRADGAPVELIDMLSNERMSAIVPVGQIEQQQQQPDG